MTGVIAIVAFSAFTLICGLMITYLDDKRDRVGRALLTALAIFFVLVIAHTIWGPRPGSREAVRVYVFENEHRAHVFSKDQEFADPVAWGDRWVVEEVES